MACSTKKKTCLDSKILENIGCYLHSRLPLLDKRFCCEFELRAKVDIIGTFEYSAPFLPPLRFIYGLLGSPAVCPGYDAVYPN